MTYADYAYYTDTYKGTELDSVSFDIHALKATQDIKLHTLNRIQNNNIPDEAKMCCCELAELIYKYENLKTGDGKTSEKVADYSVSYVGQKEIEETHNNTVRSIINKWMSLTGLLYRGCN